MSGRGTESSGHGKDKQTTPEREVAAASSPTSPSNSHKKEMKFNLCGRRNQSEGFATVQDMFAYKVQSCFYDVGHEFALTVRSLTLHDFDADQPTVEISVSTDPVKKAQQDAVYPKILNEEIQLWVEQKKTYKQCLTKG